MNRRDLFRALTSLGVVAAIAPRDVFSAPQPQGIDLSEPEWIGVDEAVGPDEGVWWTPQGAKYPQKLTVAQISARTECDVFNSPRGFLMERAAVRHVELELHGADGLRLFEMARTGTLHIRLMGWEEKLESLPIGGMSSYCEEILRQSVSLVVVERAR